MSYLWSVHLGVVSFHPEALPMFFPAHRVIVALLLTAAAGSVACTADDDDASMIEQEKRINPQDSENLGRLQLEAPTGWKLSPDTTTDATVSFTAPNVHEALEFGTPVRVLASTGCATVRSKLAWETKVCGIEVKKNKTTTLRLGALGVSQDATRLAVDFGPKAEFKVFHTPGEGTEHEIARAVFETTLVAPGQYRVASSLPLLGEVKKTIAEGKVEEIALATKDLRATIVIQPPAQRELPNAPPEACQTRDRVFVVQRNRDGGEAEPRPQDQRTYQSNQSAYPEGYVRNKADPIVAYRALPVSETTSLRVFPFTTAEAPKRYEVVVNGLVEPLDVKPGKTVVVQLDRLDVGDVEVQREDGSKYMEKGTFKVWRKRSGSQWEPIVRRTGQYSDCSGQEHTVQSSFPTGHGLDLLAGDYRVIVDYTTAEGGKQQEFVVTLP